MNDFSSERTCNLVSLRLDRSLLKQTGEIKWEFCDQCRKWLDLLDWHGDEQLTGKTKTFIKSAGVSEKHKLWKEWKQGNASEEIHFEVKRKTRRAVSKPKCKAERKGFGNVMQRDDHKSDVL